MGMSDDDDTPRTPFSREDGDDTPLGDSPHHSDAEEGSSTGDDGEPLRPPTPSRGHPMGGEAEGS